MLTIDFKSGTEGGVLFFIAYEALLYPVFIGLESHYEASKKRKIFHVSWCNNDELFKFKVNEKLEELCNDKFKIIDVKIIFYTKNDEIIKEAYILYY